MLVCVDVAYGEIEAVAAAVWAAHWEDLDPVGFRTQLSNVTSPYFPGKLYLRELPPILKVLKELPFKASLVVVDGYVYLDPSIGLGLGGHLHLALGGSTPVVGVAKRPWPGAPAVPVLRGESRRPLWVSAVGVNPFWAAIHVTTMGGSYRLPALLRWADRLARDGLTCSADTGHPLRRGRG